MTAPMTSREALAKHIEESMSGFSRAKRGHASMYLPVEDYDLIVAALRGGVAQASGGRGNYEGRHPDDMILWSAADHKDLIEVVAALGIEDSHQTPAEAVRELQAEIERLNGVASDRYDAGFFDAREGIASRSPAQTAPPDEDHPDCVTDREHELYDALMGLSSAITARQGWSKWVQGGVQIAPIVHKALRLHASPVPSTDQREGGK